MYLFIFKKKRLLGTKFATTETFIFLPGTDFMARLQEQLKYFVHNKLSTDKLWQNVRVYLSGHEVCNKQVETTFQWHICLCSKSDPGVVPVKIF